MNYGIFSGNPRTEWLSEGIDDRDMCLLEAFWYIDPAGRRWEAPKGSIINGASIPRSLWDSVGSPFTGNYRRASVVHDVALKTPGIVRSDADSMFYFACMAGGCKLMEGKLLYAGVRVGTWSSAAQHAVLDIVSMAPAPRQPGEKSPAELEVRARYTLLAADLKATGDSFEAIRAVADRHLGQGAHH